MKAALVVLIVPFMVLGVLGVAEAFTDAIRRDTAAENDYAVWGGVFCLVVVAALMWLLVWSNR